MSKETIKITELKATMLDAIIQTYLGEEDTDEMFEIICSQLSAYIDLLHPIVSSGKGSEAHGDQKNS